MASDETRAVPARRPIVRIQEPRANWRGPLTTMAIATIAGGVLLLVWHLWRAEESVRPYVRSLSETELDWKCEAGHGFRASGQTGSRACTVCKQPAFPVTMFACETHGTFEVFALFSKENAGGEQVSRWRLVGGSNREWLTADKAPPCPKCGRELRRMKQNPLANNGRPPRDKIGGGS